MKRKKKGKESDKVKGNDKENKNKYKFVINKRILQAIETPIFKRPLCLSNPTFLFTLNQPHFH